MIRLVIDQQHRKVLQIVSIVARQPFMEVLQRGWILLQDEDDGFAQSAELHCDGAKMVYSLVSLGEEVQLNTPSKIADYLRSAFEENPMQEAFYCVYLDRKNRPLGRQLITLGTATGTLVSPRQISLPHSLA